MKIAVLGAGVIGVTTAHYLAKAGHEVTVIDRQSGPALETSFAKRRMHLGYRFATPLHPLPGTGRAPLRGHEFHYSTILAQPDMGLAHVQDANGEAVGETGSRRGKATGTFFHLIAESLQNP